MSLKFLVENVPKYFSLKDVLKAVDTTCGTFNIDKFNVFRIVESGSRATDQKFLLVLPNNLKNEEFAHISDRPSSVRIKLLDANYFDLNSEKIPIEPGRTLFLSNFFTNTRLTELSGLFSKYQLRKSLLVPSIQFSSNSKYLIVRFETEREAFQAYRELDGLLVKDLYNGKLIKRLTVNLY